MLKLNRTAVFTCFAALMPAVAHAQDGAGASGSLSVSSEDGMAADGDAAGSADAGDGGYLTRFPAENNMLELGLFGGLLFPSSTHNLQDETRVQVPFESVAPDIGLRVAYFPLSFLGAEAEGAVMPTSTTDGVGATIWAVRGHVMAQWPTWSIKPFVLVGVTALGAISDSNGNDTDPAFHFGGGIKAAITRYFDARLDVRDTLSQENADGLAAQIAANGNQTHHPEVLLGLSLVLGRSEKEAPPPPPDSDGDGITDTEDKCPMEAGPAPDGCPPPPDTDGDGILDSEDKCPMEAGPEPDGCPPPPDTDGDGFTDDKDKCPSEAGIAPDGCPDRDPDKDGILDPNDKCPTEPETKNGYQDSDGCPDEVPKEVAKFTGVIKGIEFDFGKASIRGGSRKILDAAAKILIQYPDLRVEVSGHTDNVGSAEANQELSMQRAESVKEYLVSKGVDAARIKTRGAGADEPIDSNDTKVGRQKNRRIEFKLLSE